MPNLGNDFKMSLYIIMKLISITILFLFQSFCNQCLSQVDTPSNPHFKVMPSYFEKALKLLVGGNLQQAYRINGKEYSRKYFEIGLHKTNTVFGGHHPPASFTHGFSIEIAPEANPIYGFKYSTWVQASCLVFGLAGVYYTDFKYGNFKIRPEVGIGMYPFKLSAGFNIPTIKNKSFKDIQHANGQITLNILLRLKTLK